MRGLRASLCAILSVASLRGGHGFAHHAVNLHQTLEAAVHGWPSFVSAAESATSNSWAQGFFENRLEGDVAGILGGSFGVVGTLVAYEKRRFKTLERVLCPYCLGSGYLECGVCFGAESLNVANVDEETKEKLRGQLMECDDEVICYNCEGTGAVTCPNCQGEGLAMPGQLIRQLDIEMDDLEEVMSQVSVAAIQADFDMDNARKKKRLMLRRKQKAAARKAANQGA